MEPLTDQHTVDINNGIKKISVKHGMTLLSGLARNQLLLPSACGGNAKCGACRVKVVSGLSGNFSEGERSLLSDEEKASDVRLACQVKVEHDMSIIAPDDIFSARQFVGKLVSKKALTRDIMHLVIDLVKPEEISFSAGQYVQIRSQPYLDKPAVIRAFSIASGPLDVRHVELMTRKVASGICTEWIFNHLKEGDKVYFTGPYGKMTLSGTQSPVIFIAGGSGMAPIRSMLIYMKEHKISRTVAYYFGAVTSSDLFLTDELFALEKELSGFRFVTALSNEPENSGWQGERGLITDVVARCCGNLSEHEAYLCGSPGMIAACCNVLKAKGIHENKIFYDKF
jgi:Na+-transporting NADH:ubiquinone oxidoreductase subunit F